MKAALGGTGGFACFEESLAQFARFYNVHRPHQGLGGLTPAEAWGGLNLREVQTRYAEGLAKALRRFAQRE